jgi:ribonuclease VapC
MIVVDTSALLTILEEEQDAAVYARAIAEADPPLISAASVVEVGIVMPNRHGSSPLQQTSSRRSKRDGVGRIQEDASAQNQGFRQRL